MNLKEYRKSWRETEAIAIEASKTRMAKECGVERGEKFDKAWQIAWDHGHSAGIGEVEIYFRELAELIKASQAEQPEIVARLRVLVREWTSTANGSLKWAEQQGLMNREILTDSGRLGRCASDLEQLLDELSPEVKP